MTKYAKIIYRDIASQISLAVDHGELVGRLPGERELAERYGVSRVTIRNALELLIEGNILHRLSRKGTYAGRAPETPEMLSRKRIGFFLFGDGTMTHYEAALLSGLSRHCGSAGFHFFVESFADAGELQKRLTEIIRYERPDIVLLNGNPTPAAAEFINRNGIAALWTVRSLVNEAVKKYDFCYLDWYNWGYRAARYFIGQEMRRIALILGEKSDIRNLEIAEGFKAAHEESGMTQHSGLTMHCRKATIQAGFDAALSLLELEYPDAIIAGSSALGNGASLGAAQLTDNDLVPIITTSYHSEPQLNSYPLTYLDFDQDSAVKKCWRLIQRRLKHPNAAPEITHPVWKF